MDGGKLLKGEDRRGRWPYLNGCGWLVLGDIREREAGARRARQGGTAGATTSMGARATWARDGSARAGQWMLTLHS